MKKVVFRLKRVWEGRDLWAEILRGRKTVEYRNNTDYWRSRLLEGKSPRIAWFTVGYPKNNVPRLEAVITEIHIKLDLIHTHFRDVVLISDIIPPLSSV